MSCSGINNEAREWIDLAGLQPIDRSIVEKCVFNYSSNENSLSYIMYRVWNAVKSIFGSSDWQIASAIILKEVCWKDGYSPTQPSLDAEILLKGTAFANKVLSGALACQRDSSSQSMNKPLSLYTQQYLSLRESLNNWAGAEWGAKQAVDRMLRFYFNPEFTQYELNLSDLNLTNLPQEIVELRGLKTLKVNSNNLTELPEQMVKLTSLNRIEF